MGKLAAQGAKNEFDKLTIAMGKLAESYTQEKKARENLESMMNLLSGINNKLATFN